MPDVEAKLVIKVVDEATRALKSIQGNLGGIGQAVKDHSREIRNFGLAAVAAGGAITGAFALAVGAAREQIQAEKQLNAVLASTKGAAGLTADEVKRMASSLQQVTNFSDETVLQGQNMLLTFTKIGKDVFPQATEAMLNLSEALDQDVKTSALQLGKALNDPVNSLDALSRAGVQFTQEQRNMIKAMVEAGNIAGAQGIIMEELGKKVGGSARAAADPMIQLKHTLDDVAEEVGTVLIPVINDFVQAVLPVIQNVVEWIKQNPELTKTIVAITAAVGALLVVGGSLAVLLVQVNAALLAVGLTLAAGGALFLAIGGIVALLVVVTQHWEGLKWMAGQAVDYVIEKVQALINKLQELADRLNVVKQVQSLAELAQFKAQQAAAGSNLGPRLQGAQPTYEQNQAPGRAGGGYVREGLTLVGEEGPELVSLPRGSYVHTADETRQAMGATIHVGPFYISKEVDADSVIRQITRAIQLQSLQAA